MGIIFVVGMFVVPAYFALQGMFGPDFMKVLNGEGEDRVKYVREEAKPAPAKRSRAAAAASEG